MSVERTFPLKDGRSVTVREAVPEDARDWIEHAATVGAERRFMMSESFTRTLAEIESQFRTSDPNEQLWLLGLVEGRMVASANVRRGRAPKNSHTAEMGMAVRKEMRELGIGNALMETMLAWCRLRGIAKLKLGVFATNTRALALYHKFGFEEEGVLRREAYIEGTCVDEILMALWLTPSSKGS